MYNSLIDYARHAAFLLLTCFICSASAAPTGKPVSYDDPWEPVNRTIFTFNDTLDRYALKPVARGYNTVTPKPVQGLVTNFFNNLGEVRNTVNSLLQLKGSKAMISFGRFAVNSTIGMLGLIDVASPLGIEQKYEDFGLTLAQWGIPSGPYVVIPFLGSRTLRSSTGILPDAYVNPLNFVKHDSDRWSALGVNIINTRSSLLDAEDLIMGDRYSFIRDAYLQRREYLITGEIPEDDF
ncbi:VacJ family lipoprotein [Endozoicomonas sp. Mp262]|uniref:MlaA family lipoprotein n=1 Tax=Endozoicomonas sp. Mp262 TaxID=2919499 RepID=UPI0021D7E0DF